MTFTTGSSSPSDTGSDRRRYQRKSTRIRVEITHPSLGHITASTRDISDGGVSITTDAHAILPVGAEVNVRFFKVAGAVNEEPVKMRVVRRQQNILGLAFIA